MFVYDWTNSKKVVPINLSQKKYFYEQRWQVDNNNIFFGTRKSWIYNLNYNYFTYIFCNLLKFQSYKNMFEIQKLKIFLRYVLLAQHFYAWEVWCRRLVFYIKPIYSQLKGYWLPFVTVKFIFYEYTYDLLAMPTRFQTTFG